MRFETQSTMSMLNAYVKDQYGDTDVLVIIQKDAESKNALAALREDLKCWGYGLPEIFHNAEYVFIANVENIPTTIDKIFTGNTGVHMRYYRKGTCTMRNRY